MNRHTFKTAFVLALGLAACAPQPQTYSIDRVYGLGAGCDITPPDGFSGNGLLDVAPGAAQFFVGLEVRGAELVQQPAVAVGGRTLEPENRDRPIVTEQVVNYRLSRKLGATPKQYVTRITAPFSDEGTLFGAFQLVSPELATLLFDGLSPSDAMEDFVDIDMDIELRGKMSGTGAAFSTGVTTFPVRAYRSNGVAMCTKLQTLTDTCAYSGQSMSQLVKPTLACCSAASTIGCD